MSREKSLTEYLGYFNAVLVGCQQRVQLVDEVEGKEGKGGSGNSARFDQLVISGLLNNFSHLAIFADEKVMVVLK